MKRTIRLTEGELRGMIQQAVNSQMRARTRRPMNENMNKTVSLTESQLRRMIQESVKKAVNELNYKTYLSAADKAMERDRKAGGMDVYDGWTQEYEYVPSEDSHEFERSEKLKKAARDAFSDEFNLDGDYLDWHEGKSDYYINGLNNPQQKDGAFEPTGNYDTIGDRVSQRAKDDLSNYRGGKTKYTKGKGWQ